MRPPGLLVRRVRRAKVSSDVRFRPKRQHVGFVLGTCYKVLLCCDKYAFLAAGPMSIKRSPQTSCVAISHYFAAHLNEINQLVPTFERSYRTPGMRSIRRTRRAQSVP